MTDQPNVSVKNLAEILMLGTRRVQQLADEGVIERNERDEYPIWTCVQGYIKYLQQNRSNNGAEANQVKIDFIKSQTKLNDIKIAKESDVILTVEDVQQVIESAIASARAEFESGDRKLKKYLDKEYQINVDLTELQKRTNATLTKLAEHTPKFSQDDAQSLAEMETSFEDSVNSMVG